MKISTFIEHIKKSADLGPPIVFHHYLPHQDPQYDDSPIVSQPILDILERFRLRKLYTHQTQAIRHIKEGKDVLVSTPTASGKSLIRTYQNLLLNYLPPISRQPYTMAIHPQRTGRESKGKFQISF
jgi:DEAD/DEAH box helicase domain-containing protein